MLYSLWFNPEILTGSPERGRQTKGTRMGGKQAIF